MVACNVLRGEWDCKSNANAATKQLSQTQPHKPKKKTVFSRMSSDEGEINYDSLPPEAKPLNEQELKIRKKVLKLMKKDLETNADAQEVKEKVAEAIENVADDILICFIRGYSYEAEWAAVSARELLKTLIWRVKNDVDRILERDLPNRERFTQVWKSGVYGSDKDGRIIIVDRTGKIEPSELMDGFTIDELQNHHVKTMEMIRRFKENIYEERGYRLYKHVVVMDLDGFGTGHMGNKFRAPLRSMIDVDQWFYPEILHRMFIINTPFVFKMLWKMAKPWLHPVTQQKIIVCGGEKEYLKHFADNGIEKSQVSFNSYERRSHTFRLPIASHMPLDLY